MNDHTESNSSPKFTKGEKCIFAHLVFTFSATFLVAVIFLMHLFLVNHSFQDVFITRRLDRIYDKSELDKFPVGQLFVNDTPVTYLCNTLLLAPNWSVGPGHCVAIRSEPDLYYLLNKWRIKYIYSNSDVTYDIERTIVHPHFDRDTFANNIGLVKHDTIQYLRDLNNNKLDSKILYNELNNDLVLTSWSHHEQNKDVNVEVYPVRLMNKENCSYYMSPIIELRDYEFCTTIKTDTDTILGHGSIITDLKTKHFLGFFTWGERKDRSLPLVILNLTDFRQWLQVITL